MIRKIRELLAKVPFTPFIVHTSGGREYRVETPDHAQVGPKGFQVNIWFDDDGSVTLAALHITAVETDKVPVS
ncbi:MAG TPA: hypothetical protein VGO11_13950 [Chthoniobacteraceae bacterium]|jgi:hypothetical protein|nr:hypothetical protein [Chthoniobacteraceae bacterium]